MHFLGGIIERLRLIDLHSPTISIDSTLRVLTYPSILLPGRCRLLTPCPCPSTSATPGTRCAGNGRTRPYSESGHRPDDRSRGHSHPPCAVASVWCFLGQRTQGSWDAWGAAPCGWCSSGVTTILDVRNRTTYSDLFQQI